MSARPLNVPSVCLRRGARTVHCGPRWPSPPSSTGGTSTGWRATARQRPLLALKLRSHALRVACRSGGQAPNVAGVGATVNEGGESLLVGCVKVFMRLMGRIADARCARLFCVPAAARRCGASATASPSAPSAGSPPAAAGTAPRTSPCAPSTRPSGSGSWVPSHSQTRRCRRGPSGGSRCMPLHSRF